MDYLSSIILGLVQGLTEFLPISSSGHLVLAQHLLKFQGPEVAFDLLLHLGTTLALIIYFRGELAQIGKSFLSKSAPDTGRRLFWMIVLASIPTAIIGFAFKEQFESQFAQPRAVIFQLWTTGILLLLSDMVKPRNRTEGRVGSFQALAVGIAQGIAIIPGISRSGATIATGIYCGMDRGTAARFSFLLSIPAIFGASLLEAKNIAGVSSLELLPYAVGVLVALVSGYLSIDLLLRILVRRKLWAFSIYLLVIGLVGLLFT